MILRGHEAEIYNAQFSPDGRRIVTASLDRTARVWDSVIGVELAVLPGHETWLGSAQFSPDGERIVTAGCDESDPMRGCVTGSVRVWDAATGRELNDLGGYETNVSSAQFSPDGKIIVIASYDGAAHVWDAITGQEVVILRAKENWIFSAQFSSDSNRIVTAGCEHTPSQGCTGGAARVWDVATGRELTAVWRNGTYITQAKFSPDGARVITDGSDGTVRVWDIETGLELGMISVKGTWIQDAQFSPDGMRIALACSDDTARLWDATTKQELAVLRGHEDSVQRVQFSPDGKQVVTASNDGTARVWEVTTGQPLAILRGYEHGGWVTSAQFSPDGTRIISTGCDERGLYDICIAGTARLYLVNVEDLAALAKTRVTRELTCQERVQYLHEDRVCPTPTPTP